MIENDPDYDENTKPVELKPKRGAIVNPFLRAVLRRLANERAEQLKQPDTYARDPRGPKPRDR